MGKKRGFSRENFERKRSRCILVLDRLAKSYPNAGCSLKYHTPFQLLVAVVLSAQCTDAKVNAVLPKLFSRFPRPEDLANARQREVEAVIRPLGLFRAKAGNIIGLARETNGNVPATMAELEALPGVGRKTANVVHTELYGRAEGIAVDTHCGRLARRLGFTKEEYPAKVERELLPLAPENRWASITHLFIAHGRAVCAARKPRCSDCVIAEHCPSSTIGN